MANIEAVFQTTKETLSGDRTVLVADDDPIFRRLLQKRLQDWGYKVIAVDNGEKAWEALQQPGTPPSLSSSWIGSCRESTGIEICRRIRGKQQPSYPIHPADLR